ncbi:MAG: tRNA (adenosine(37)-N6)-dimethylallyltransferase MiaA [Flavobacteriaceae bacterium]|nr:tRNA (adenosine(37)-N6)-dimethylallyltransferase MiaA [Flavobacteriaceae bacterium]
MNKYVISIVGPTGIGKTKLSLKLAKFYKTEIISADSRQFYKEIAIGTASPSAANLKEIKHHFIHHKSILEPYSVGDFEKDAINLIQLLHQKKSIIILIGGSGLYINSITKGLNSFPKTNPEIRANLNLIFKKKGGEFLAKELKRVDPITYAKIDLKNPRRIIRALEIYRSSGKSYSSFLGNEKNSRKFKIINLGLTAERKIIYNRIEKRVEKMMENGLLEEARSVYEYRHLNALNTVGYKELFKYFQEKISLEEAIEEIKKNTRRYAKRQLTWFKKQKNTTWFDYKSNLDVILDQINKEIQA